MFSPKYTITDELLSNIKKINTLVTELNHRYFSTIVQVELERAAQAVSTYASTSIEGNPLPLTEVKRILKSTPSIIRESEKEVLNYNNALKELSQKLKTGRISLSLELILVIHKQVMKNLLPKFETGSLRQKPVVVNDPKTGSVVYLPPDAQDIKPLMNELISFIVAGQNNQFSQNWDECPRVYTSERSGDNLPCSYKLEIRQNRLKPRAFNPRKFITENRKTIDPLILAGIFHKQLVLIHPFMDGNGRTTRLATKVLLAEMGLNTFTLFSFENYYNKNVTRYFQTVGERGNYYDLIGKIEFTPWLEYFTEGIIDELLRVQKTLPQINITPDTQLQEYHQKILEFIKENGFIKDRNYAKLVKRAKATRALDFKKLINLGLIERRAKGKATYYILSSANPGKLFI